MYASMAELVDALDSKSGARKGVWVRVPLGVQSAVALISLGWQPAP